MQIITEIRHVVDLSNGSSSYVLCLRAEGMSCEIPITEDIARKILAMSKYSIPPAQHQEVEDNVIRVRDLLENNSTDESFSPYMPTEL